MCGDEPFPPPHFFATVAGDVTAVGGCQLICRSGGGGGGGGNGRLVAALARRRLGWGSSPKFPRPGLPTRRPSRIHPRLVLLAGGTGYSQAHDEAVTGEGALGLSRGTSQRGCAPPWGSAVPAPLPLAAVPAVRSPPLEALIRAGPAARRRCPERGSCPGSSGPPGLVSDSAPAAGSGLGMEPPCPPSGNQNGAVCLTLTGGWFLTALLGNVVLALGVPTALPDALWFALARGAETSVSTPARSRLPALGLDLRRYLSPAPAYLVGPSFLKLCAWS